MTILHRQSLLERRRRAMSPTYGLTYARPVEPVRAQGVWMYEADGGALLDAYNNVPVVGHCHPKVVEALSRQAALINTNTRYLTEGPVALAERLLATFPAEVDNVVFTCTGTEANDLALRVCKAVTGATGVIITELAYHGNSSTVIGLSPLARQPLGPQVYTVPAPLGPEGPARFAADVRACIAQMKADGVAPAALIVDTLFSSDGVVADPPGFLAAAVAEVRAAGGLFIADEVQPGFGRTGSHMWGFARHGIVPDLVTLGKPMGNGHPIGAMAARSDLMTTFSKLSRYFNTFGGNTVSCAVAMAVLDVIEQEDLMGNARTVGARLGAGLADLADRYPNLGAVRGAGLYYGVDIRPNPAKGLDAIEEALRIVNGMRERGVLISTPSGRGAPSLKIRPPLPFAVEHVEILLTRMEQVLNA